MNCNDIIPDLVGYIQDELSTEEAERVRRHLANCAACRAEEESLRMTLRALQHDLVPLEPSADFRRSLFTRIENATEDAAEQEEAVDTRSATRNSQRYMREMDRSLGTKLIDFAKRSPYLAGSVLIHAAAAVILVFVVVHSTTDQGPSINNSQPDPHIGSEEFAINLGDSYPLQRRLQATSFQTVAVRASGGVRVDLAPVAQRLGDTLVMQKSRDLRCLVAYVVDPENDRSVKTLLERHQGAVAVPIHAAQVEIPEAVAGNYFASSLATRVIDLDDRLEFWTESEWGSFENGGIAFPGDMTVPVVSVTAAVRLRQRRMRG